MSLKYAKICKIYATHMQNMQNMHFRFSYAKYARICAPHFADVPADNLSNGVNRMVCSCVGRRVLRPAPPAALRPGPPWPFGPFDSDRQAAV